MVEIRIVESRTPGMSRSEINDAMCAGTLQLCPYHDLYPNEADGILTEFLKVGEYSPNTPRTMSVLELGTSRSGVPCALIEIVGPSGNGLRYRPSVCEFCSRLGGCDPGDAHAKDNDFWDDGPDDDEE